MPSNRIFNSKSKIRVIMWCCKKAPEQLLLWSSFHPSSRKTFPADTVGAVKRSIRIYNNLKKATYDFKKN